MADTIISNTPGNQNSGDGMLMNVVLAIVFVAIAVGAVMMYQNGAFQTDSPKPDVTDINVTVPTPPVVPTPTPTPAE